MFSSSPTSTDPLLFNAGTLRMSTGKTRTDEAEHHRDRREREKALFELLLNTILLPATRRRELILDVFSNATIINQPSLPE